MLQIVINYLHVGPAYMKDFCINESVLKEFEEVAIKRFYLYGDIAIRTFVVYLIISPIDGVSAKKLLPPERPILKLHSKDVQHYRSDELAKLIPEIVNPGSNYFLWMYIRIYTSYNYYCVTLVLY